MLETHRRPSIIAYHRTLSHGIGHQPSTIDHHTAPSRAIDAIEGAVCHRPSKLLRGYKHRQCFHRGHRGYTDHRGSWHRGYCGDLPKKRHHNRGYCTRRTLPSRTPGCRRNSRWARAASNRRARPGKAISTSRVGTREPPQLERVTHFTTEANLECRFEARRHPWSPQAVGERGNILATVELRGELEARDDLLAVVEQCGRLNARWPPSGHRAPQ